MGESSNHLKVCIESWRETIMSVESKYLQDYRQMERSDFVHFMDIQVRWGDADVFGHINNTLYSRFFESSRLTYFEDVSQLEFSYGMQIGIILADMKISYLQQLHYPAEIEIGSRISRMGSSSLDLDAAVFIKGQDQVISTSRATCVWFDYTANETRPIPNEKREKIVTFERIPPA